MREMNPTQEVQFEYDRWHGQFVNYILRAISLLGILLLAATFPAASRDERISFTFIYLVLLAVTFAPFSKRIKASVAPIAGYLIGLYTLLEYGPWSDATLFLLAGILFAALLFNRQIDRLFLVLSSGTIIII